METLDSIKVVRQTYHGNVIIGNHFNYYQKLCRVVSDEPEFYEHISESFLIYSELDKFTSTKKVLDRSWNTTCQRILHRVWPIHNKFSKWNCHKKDSLTNLWCTPFFSKTQNIGILSKEERESLHCSINKQLWHNQSIRNENEKLVHVVKNQESFNTADKSLAKVTPWPKCNACNDYLQKGA